MITRSYAIEVRDGVMKRLKALEWFRPFEFTTNKSVQIAPQSIPFCAVYLLDESGQPDGDANAGETRFRVTIRLGFSVIVLNNKPEQAEYQLDAAYQVITGALYNDPTFYGNPDAMIQGFTRSQRTHQFGAVGMNNELPVAELRFDLTCDLGAVLYPPVVIDNLETIHVETAFPPGGTPEEIAAVQQVKVEYDLPQN